MHKSFFITFNWFLGLVAHINKIVEIGERGSYLPWERDLTRKLNYAALLGMFNVFVGLAIFVSLGYTGSLVECVVVLLIAPLIFFLNKRYGYLPAFYLFTCLGCFLFFFLSVKMGEDSFAFLYFLTLVIGIIQMGSRKELFKHMTIIVFICSATVLLMAWCFVNSVFAVAIPREMAQFCKYFNICFSFLTTAFFLLIISQQSIRQDALLQSALKQKEVLLAELFHRVKNNLNIVTSLLNLKKETSSSPETRLILEECRNHVFSMALVHTKMYKTNDLEHLNFKEYLSDLLPELINSIGGQENVDFELTSPDIQLRLDQAIPCGLIVNELVTNSFKHARVQGKKLHIRIGLRNEQGLVTLQLGDNGPGRTDTLVQKGSLGMELIKSLAEQLGAEYVFKNDNGLQFGMQFRN